MIIRKKYIIIALMVSICFFSSIITKAQSNNINLSFSNLTIEGDYFWLENKLPNLQLDYNRNVLNYLSIGGYIGAGLYEEWLFEKDSTSMSLEYINYTHSLHYGLNANFHILPFILEKKLSRFDLYVSGKMGIISLFSTESDNIVPKKGHYFDYSIMGGTSFYLSKKFGLFLEAGYKNFEYHKGFNTKYGLTLRF